MPATLEWINDRCAWHDCESRAVARLRSMDEPKAGDLVVPPTVAIYCRSHATKALEQALNAPLPEAPADA